MSAPVRIQRKRTRGWEMPLNAVVVSRPSEWGNPYRVARARDLHGGGNEWWIESTSSVWRFKTKTEANEAAVTLFRHYLGLPQNTRLRDRAKLALKGRDLACWCPLDQPCHADVLLELANQP